MKYFDLISESTKYLNKIIKLSASDFEKTGYTIKNDIGGEINFFDSSAGCEGTYSKGSTLFDVKGMDIQIATRVGANGIELVVFDDNGNYLTSEMVTLKKGISLFRKIMPNLEMPYAVFPNNKRNEPVFTSKFETIIRNTNNRPVFILKNSAQKEISFYRGDNTSKNKGKIEDEIAKFEKAGQKIRPKATKILKEIFPELYGEPDFELNDSILISFDKFSKDKLYQKFLSGMDKNSRTGWAIEIDSKGVYIHGLIGNTSDGYAVKRFDFSDYGKTPNSMNTMKKFMISSGAIDYTIALAGRIFGEMEAYSNYIKNGGVLD